MQTTDLVDRPNDPSDQRLHHIWISLLAVNHWADLTFGVVGILVLSASTRPWEDTPIHGYRGFLYSQSSQKPIVSYSSLRRSRPDSERRNRKPGTPLSSAQSSLGRQSTYLRLQQVCLSNLANGILPREMPPALPTTVFCELSHDMRIDNRGRSDLDHQCPIHVIRLVDKSQ